MRNRPTVNALNIGANRVNCRLTFSELFVTLITRHLRCVNFGYSLEPFVPASLTHHGSRVLCKAAPPYLRKEAVSPSFYARTTSITLNSDVIRMTLFERNPALANNASNSASDRSCPLCPTSIFKSMYTLALFSIDDVIGLLKTRSTHKIIEPGFIASHTLSKSAATC